MVLKSRGQHQQQVFYKEVGIGAVALVHHEHIGDLHQARLHRLHLIARLGHEHHNCGIGKLYQAIKDSDKSDVFHQKKLWLYTEKAMQLIQKRRMKDIDRKQLSAEIKNTKDFNLYRFVQRFA